MRFGSLGCLMLTLRALENSYKWITVFLLFCRGTGYFVPVDKDLPLRISKMSYQRDCESFFYDAEYKELFENAADF